MSECKAIKKEESSNSGPKNKGPVKKPTSETEQNARVSGEEENMWDLGNSHFIKLTEYGKKWYVNIRKFYNTDGAPKPGKDGIITDLEYMSMSTGIMLPIEQWRLLKAYVNDIDEAMQKNS